METLGGGELELEVLPEAGGRIHRLRAHGVDLLRTPDDPGAHLREPLFWGSYPLVPWSNRIPGGRLAFRGRTYQLPKDYGDHAIHGEAYALPWTLLENGDRLRLGFEGGGEAGAFPWPYHAEQVIELDDSSLVLEISMTNLAEVPIPGGLGIHPWFAAGRGLRVEVPADLVYPVEDCIPTGEPEPVAGERDLRVLRDVPWGLDDLWTGLTRSQVVLERPAEGIRVSWTFPPAADHVVLASFGDFRAVAVEPVTHANDGHARLEAGLAGGVDVLGPGETLAVRHRLEISASA